jgi:hypothetical protein
MKSILFPKAGVLSQVFFSVLFIPAILAGFLLAAPVHASDLDNYILDIFPLAVDDNFNALSGLDAGFSNLQLRGDNPFGNKYDRSLWAGNNQTNIPSALPASIGPISGNGFSVSWWYRWNDFSGSGNIDILDGNQKNLLGAYLGLSYNTVKIPEGAGSVIWDKYNLTSEEMGDGRWHQFILSSDVRLSCFKRVSTAAKNCGP